MTANFLVNLIVFISYLLTLYIYILIAAAILSWLIAFNVVNTRNHIVAIVGEFLYRITEPALRPVRSILPNLGGIDISPVIVILIIVFIQSVIFPSLIQAVS
jgi:YggT family protein